MGLREENDALRRQLSNALTAIAALCLKSDQPLQLSQIDLFRADGATISTAPDGKGGILIAAICKEEINSEHTTTPLGAVYPRGVVACNVPA